MGFGPAYGTGKGGGGAVDIFTKKDGNPALFANTSARDTYFQSNPDELTKLKASGDAVGIGTANQITAAYVYKENKWQPIATNFKGDKGAPGAPGDGIDYSHLTEGQIPKWDATARRFTNSGVSSPEDGEVKMGPNSLIFGHHKMSSAVADVTFTNLDTGKNYSFVYQTMEPGDKDAFLREVDSNVEEVVRVPVGTDDITNPINDVTIDADEVFYSGTFILSQDTQNVVLEMYDATKPTELIWKDVLGDLPSGENDVVFDTPFKCRKGFKYKMKLLSTEGDLVAKGTGTSFSWKIRRAKMYDRKIATQDWINAQSLVNDVMLTGNQFSFAMLDGTKKTVTLPAEGGLSSAPYKFYTLRTDRVIPVSEVSDNTPVYQLSEDRSISITIPATNVLPPGKDTAIIVSNEGRGTGAVTVRASNTDGIDNVLTKSFTVPKNNVVLFISDFIRAVWHTVILRTDDAGSGSTLNEGQIVKGLETASNGKDLLVRYYDDTSSTLTFQPWVSDINKLNTAVADLSRLIKNKTKFYVYRGSTVPTDVPRGSRGGYYFTFHGQASDLILSTPDSASKISDGTILFIDNNSSDYNITVTAQAGETIGGQASITLAPEATAWYVRNGNDWQEMYAGYLPTSHQELINEMKTLIAADANFMRSLSVQSDDPAQVSASVKSLEFKGFDVTTPADDTTKGIIKFKGATFENPDGSKVVTDVLKLVGMEVVDPGDGTPPKLMLTGGALPLPHPTSAYAFFDAAATVPDTVDFTSLTKFTNGKVTVTKSTADPQYAYILIPAAEGAGADRIGEQGGLPAFWDKSSKTYTVNGQSETFTVFRSPYPLKEQDVTLIIYH